VLGVGEINKSRSCQEKRGEGKDRAGLGAPPCGEECDWREVWDCFPAFTNSVNVALHLITVSAYEVINRVFNHHKTKLAVFYV
jgi:hypothetical protein